jgi:chromosome segregation ATPase
VKDPRSTVNPSNDTEYSNKELRQKEMKLKKKEDEIKKSKAEIEDCSKDNHRLKSYSLKLEAQVKELENSNRILLYLSILCR